MDDGKRFDLFSIGEPMVEFNQTTPGAPEYLQGFGGDTSNMIVAAARSGARTAYGTRIGDDAFGRLFLELWRREGVNLDAVEVDPDAHTGVYFVSHDARGHEFSYLRAGSAASRMRPQHLSRQVMDASRIVHASGISMAISSNACDTVLEAFESARAQGASISFDANLRTRLWPIARARATIALAASFADWFFPSLEDARALSGRDEPDALVDWAHGLGARAVFLKLGAEGVVVSDGTIRQRLAGHRIRTVDATGAGDCFCGACLARIAAGDSILEAARYANAAAALSTTGFGAVAPLPRPDDVRRLLAQAQD